MQRKSKIRNKVMVVVEFIVQRNGLAILASYNSRAFIVAEPISGIVERSEETY